MKVCEICGDEIATKDGENICRDCNDCVDRGLTKVRNKLNKWEREKILRSLGLVKVKGNLGGTYWE